MISLWLLGLLPVAAVGYIIFAYRKKGALRDADREERVIRLYRSSKQDAAGASVASAPPGATPAARNMPVDSVPLPYCRRSPILTQPHALLYQQLKSTFPDHEIFVHFNLAGMIEVAPGTTGAERDERRRAISQLTVDCAVCTKSMGLVFAVDLAPAGTDNTTFKSRCLEAAGVRYLRVDPVHLSRQQDVRAGLLGGSG